MNPSPTSEEKIMAAFAHGSVILAFIGPVIPLMMWMSARKKSKFVAFQSLQAMAYQTLMLWLGMLAILAVIILVIAAMLMVGFFLGDQGVNSEYLVFLIQPLMMFSILGVSGILALAGFAGAFYCGRGQNFYYPFFGQKLEAYLADKSGDENALDEKGEDQLVAAACHTTALIQLWGILTPLLAWFSLKERSLYLRFQIAQSLWYQVIALILYIATMSLYFIGVFGMIFAAALLDANGLGREYGMIVILGFVFLMLLFASVILLLFPLYHLFAFIASIRVMRGDAYRYPLLGNFLARRMNIS